MTDELSGEERDLATIETLAQEAIDAQKRSAKKQVEGDGCVESILLLILLPVALLVVRWIA